MDSAVFEWCFKCDKASQRANELFDKVMDRGWLMEHGISPFDTDAAWEEVMKRLSDLKESCVLTVVRVTEPNPRWDLFQENLMKGNEK